MNAKQWLKERSFYRNSFMRISIGNRTFTFSVLLNPSNICTVPEHFIIQGNTGQFDYHQVIWKKSNRESGKEAYWRNWNFEKEHAETRSVPEEVFHASLQRARTNKIRRLVQSLFFVVTVSGFISAPALSLPIYYPFVSTFLLPYICWTSILGALLVFFLGVVSVIMDFSLFPAARLDISLDEDTKKNYNDLRASMYSLLMAHRLWFYRGDPTIVHLSSDSQRKNGDRVQINPEIVRRPWITGSEEVVSIKLGRIHLTILPGGTILEQGRRVVCSGFEESVLLNNRIKYLESSGFVPQDCRSLEQVWIKVQMSNESGQILEELRQFPLCDYGLMGLYVGGPIQWLMISDYELLDQFDTSWRKYVLFILSERYKRYNKENEQQEHREGGYQYSRGKREHDDFDWINSGNTSGEDVIKTCYEILNCAPNCSDADLKRAYRELVKEHHPDTADRGSRDEQIDKGKRFREIKEAYDILREHRK